MRTRLLWITGLVLAGASVALAAQDSTPASAGADSQRLREKQEVLAFCQQLDATSPATPAGTTDRTTCWKSLQLQGISDALVNAKYQAAVADYDRAVKADSAKRTSDSSAAAVDRKMQATQRAIQARNLDDASSSVEDVLSIQPNNQRALALKQRIDALKRARQLKITLLAIGAAVLVLAAGLGVLAKKLGKKHGEKVAQKKTEAAQRKAVLKIVDGVGRGKLYTIDGSLFRIGAASSDKPEEKNDLVLSDSAASISRYHCSILRKDGRFYLIDASLNGTELNDEPLARGDHHALRDGDEFTLANVARLKFLMM
jgi:FHA domain-containing protein